MLLDRNGFGFWSLMAKRAFKATFTRPSSPDSKIKDTLKESEVALYIHIPFCKSKCLYCPYVSFTRREKLVSKYIEALKAEIRMYGDLLRESGVKITDIHAGGGTPSLLSGSDFHGILDTIAESFDSDQKIAIEANPDDLKDEGKVSGLVDSGVSEVSLGVQSFNRKTLKKLGRTHTEVESIASIENLRAAGIDHLNADMMYMVPGQTLEEWVDDLRMAAEQDIDEITCYPTLITSHCIGYKMIRSRRTEPQPDKSIFRKMVYETFGTLEPAGYESVEIYGFCREDGWKYATVNYEMEGPLLGFGCGATGFTGGYEYQNVCLPEEYIRSIRKGDFPIAGSRFVDIKERAIRYTTCRLFVCKELDLNGFKRKFGEDFGGLLGKTGFGRALRLLRLIGITKKEGQRIKLTRKGLFTAHQICWAFVLNVPCRICEEFLKNPWPSKVIIP